MPISPDDAARLAEKVGQVFEEAQIKILGHMSRILAVGLDWASGWEQDKRDQAGPFRRLVGGVLDGLRSRTRRAVAEAAHEAVRIGTEAADEDLGPRAKQLPPAPKASERQIKSLQDDLDKATTRVGVQSQNAYQRIVTKVANQVDAGEITRLTAAKRAMGEFANEGITGFVDKSGRNWELKTYAEMATRTKTAEIMVDAHVERLGQAGVKLVIVSQAPYECPLCKPWEGQILVTGPGATSGEHTVTVNGVTIKVKGSLDEARSKGLFHPNCRHNVSAYFPGVSRKAEKPDTKGVTYKDVEKQRYLERQARKWDRRVAAALTDDDRKAAQAKVKDYKAKIKQLTDETGLKRKTNRESDSSAAR